VPADGTVRFAKYDFLSFLFNDNLMRSLHHFWDYCCRSSEHAGGLNNMLSMLR